MKQILLGSSFAVVLIAIKLAFSKGAFQSHIPRILQDLYQLRGHVGSRPFTDSHNDPMASFHHHGFVVKNPNHVMFHHPATHRARNRGTHTNRSSSSRLYGWLQDALTSLGLNPALEALKFQQFNKRDDTNQSSSEGESEPKVPFGTVIRTATKGYDKQTSVPSSPLYTTKKESRASVVVLPEGIEGDYNHYRTMALNSTPDRAVSILTSDIIRLLREAGWTKVQDGDLGENIYVDGVDYNFFQIGKRYRFHHSHYQEETTENTKVDVVQQDGVVVEITERIEPCGNLCRLPYINDESLAPRDRLEQCKKFLFWLDEKEGLRGWYGKVIGDGGMVKIGDKVSPFAVVASVE
jgi:MOSC domain-containing protein YiiM